MGEISWTAEAERWMRDIHDYIALDSPAAARRVVEGIYPKAQLLSRCWPGPTSPSASLKSATSIMALLAGIFASSYMATYLVRADGLIEILGVFHGALDIERYLL